MADRLIGMEIAPGQVRVAVLGQHRDGITVLALEQRPYADAAELAGLLGTLVPGGCQLTDRVATALPAGQAYVRTLNFPFKERRKVLAAAPFELAATLPVAMEECHLALLTPSEHSAGAQIVAAAAPHGAVTAALAPFEQGRIPLHALDLMPYPLALGFGATIGTGVLLCISETEAVLTGLREGAIVADQHLPLNGGDLDAGTVTRLLRAAAACSHQLGGDAVPVLLTGALATPQLLDRLHAFGLPGALLTVKLGHREIPPAFIPAAALALRAKVRDHDRSFNFRHGLYAFRGEAAALQKTLWVGAGLLGASLLLSALATGIGYRDKQRQAEALLQQMNRQYRETFPGSVLTVDAALQMQSKLQELRNRAAALGIGSQPRVLTILRELSAVTERTPYAVEELTCDQAACSLTGSTDSFEAVSRIKEQLAKSALFGTIEVAETRKAIDGNRVEFRLRLPLLAKGGEQ